MPVSRLCRAAAAVLATALMLALAPPASADVPSDETRVLTLLQQARSAAGAPALQLNASLSSVARGWAAKMASEGTMSHNSGVGSQVTATRLSENVGMGGSIDALNQAWLNSPPHRANMLDTGVNSVGVGVAWANGTVFLVQDFGQLAVSAPTNRPPATPSQPAPANASTLRTTPTQAAALYSDPEGTAGRIFFAVLDEAGAVVRQVWSPVVCSGCLAGVSFTGLPDGFYGLVSAAFDGTAASAVSPIWAFTVDRSAPLAPTALQRVGGNATAVYHDSDGTAGWLRIYVVSSGGVVLNEGWTARVCSGCTATYPLPALAPGSYTLYAIAYDGLLSPAVGPVAFGV